MKDNQKYEQNKKQIHGKKTSTEQFKRGGENKFSSKQSSKKLPDDKRTK